MREELDELEHTVEVACALIDRLQKENKALRAEIDQNRIDLEEYRRDVEALRAENERLRAERQAFKDGNKY